MDPNANIARQRELAAEILRLGSSEEHVVSSKILLLVLELAELVQALDEWRLKGGFDPYGAATREALINEARDLLCEQIRDPVGEANPEYTRGVVELINRATGSTADELETLAAEIGVKL